jgi:hypothetical protein
MPTPFGGDRVITRPGGEIILLSSTDKGWLARQSRGHGGGVHPGSAVQWEGAVYEVVSLEEMPGGRRRYHLLPWSEELLIRASEAYDPESEQTRVALHSAAVSHRKRSLWMFVLAPLAGHLPRPVQERMESDYGISASRMTMISALPTFVFALWTAVHAPIQGLPHGEPLPGWVYLLGTWWMLESVYRIRYALATGPIGSVAGVAADRIWRFFVKQPVPAKPEVLVSQSSSVAPPDVAERDAFLIREHFLALLTPQEQKLLEARFAFDPLRWGRITAYAILAISILGLAASVGEMLSGYFRLTGFLSLALAGGLAVEQVMRLRRVARGEPAGSILAPIVRMFCNVLLKP